MRARAKSAYIILAFVCGLLRLDAQSPVYRQYTVDDGLPSNEVYNSFEDSLGYMWFATDHGISRFDGYTFRNYSTRDGLTHNTIFGFFEDHRRRIWMRAFNSTLCYMANGKIHPYRHNEILRRFLGRNFIQTFAIDSAGDLWFMSIRKPFGLYRQDAHTGRIRKIALKKGCNAFIRELDNNSFIAGVDFSDTSQAHHPGAAYEDHCRMFHVDVPRNHYGMVRAARKQKGHYLFSFDHFLLEIRDQQAGIQVPSKYSVPVTHIYADRGGDTWVTGEGLYRHGKDSIPFFKDLLINSIRQDRRGNYWISTTHKGIYIIPNMEVSTLIQDATLPYILLVYKNRLLALDHSNTLLSLPMDETPKGQFKKILSIGAAKNVIHNANIDVQREELYLGGKLYSTVQLDKNKLRFKGVFSDRMGFTRSSFFHRNNSYFAGNTGWGMQDSAGKPLYISWRDGFTRFCSTICIDSSGTVWIGASDGLYRYRNGHTEAFRAADILFRQNIVSLKCMPEGVVVASTRGAGILLIDGEKTYAIRQADGLSTDLCGRLAVDGNTLWVCTNKGLNKLTIRRSNGKLAFEVMRLQTEHGLPSNLIYDAIRYKDLLILCTGKGLAWFDVRRFRLNGYSPPVRIETVFANKRLIGQDAALSYKETNLSFGFTGLLYNNAGKIVYRYKLEGYEPDWNFTTERSVRYFNLPAGSYCFVVEAMNENGDWSGRPARYDFFIPLHFTKTWWFRLLLAIAILSGLWLVARYYLKQRQLQARMTTNVLAAELKTLRSQMKPHFMFNSLSSIQHFILDSDQESAHLYLSRFSKLMRQILDNTSKDSIALAGELEMLELYLSLEKLRFGTEFGYSIELDQRLDPQACEIPPMLIQPYLENAIWHGLLPKKDQARLWLRFYPEGQSTLVCEIEDNGIGREAASSRRKSGHRSAGMKNIEERIGILNHMQGNRIRVEVSDLHDDTGQALGTKVTLKFSNTIIPEPL